MFFVDVIYKGRLNNNKPYEVRQLTLQEKNHILLLQDDVVKTLENKDVLATLTDEEYENLLSGHGLMVGVFVQGSLIAYRALLVPQVDDPEHLGRDIGLMKEELNNVIYQEITVVHPEFRGNRLQQTLARIIMKELKQQDESYRYVCCTVAPFNIPSLKDKFNQGMKIAALKEKYDQQLRYIFMKDFGVNNPDSWTAVKDIQMSDITSQQHLLADGWLGFQMHKQADHYYVSYGRK